MFYRCDDCGHVYDEEERLVWKEKVGRDDDSLPPGYLVYSGCPKCKSDQYTEVNYCENCEKEFTENQFCEKCLDVATKYVDLIRKETSGKEVAELIDKVLEK